MAGILLVEDRDEVRTMFRRVLETAGHTVIEAADGAQALQALENQQPAPDVVVTDIFMPNMDGFDLVRALQSKPKRPAVIGMSGDPRRVTGDLAKMLGARVVLIKPFAPKVLLDAVAAALPAPVLPARPIRTG